MSKFYTRGGDDGYTGFLGEGRVPKYHPRTETVGEIDEANAALGVARAFCNSAQSKTLLLAVQKDLYGMMAEVAAVKENAARFRTIDAGRVAWLEEHTDAISQSVAIPKEFIVPGDSQAGALLSVARTAVRRAERRVAHLAHLDEIENIEILHYMNRLSSLCFVLELLENSLAGKDKPTIAKGV